MKKEKPKYKVKAITDPRTGKRKYFYGKSIREVNQKVLMWQSENAPEGRTFEKVADEWWGEAYDNIEWQTAKSYKPALARAKEEFCGVPVSNIKPKDIQQLLNRMVKQGYSKHTIGNQRLIINLIFKHAIMQGYMDTNPCTVATVPKDAPRTARKPATPEEERIVRETWHIWLFPFFELMTGMRKGEILALQWKDIDLDEGYIYITKSVEHINNQPRVKAPKTEAGTRYAPLLDQLRDALLTISPRHADNFIFSDDGKKPLTNRRYITLYNNYRKTTGIKCTSHQLRHSFATIAFEAGIDAKAVSGVIGHKHISTTMNIYTQFRREAANKFKQEMNAKTAPKMQ